MMAKLFTKILHSIKHDAIQSTELARANFHTFGYIGAIGHPLYWYIWTHLLPQGNDILLLRLLGGLACIPLIIFRKQAGQLVRWMPLYWHFVLIFTLPFTFTLLLLANNYSNIYMLSAIMSIFFLLMFVYSIRVFVICILTGALLGLATYYFFLPKPHALNQYLLLEASPLFAFAFVSGSVVSYTLRNALMAQLREKSAQERLMAVKALAGSIAHEMRNPLGQIRFSLLSIRNLLPRPVAHAAEGTPPPSLSLHDLNTLYSHLAQGETSIDQGLQIISMTLDEVSGRPINQASLEYLSASKATHKALEEYCFDTPGERAKVNVLVKNNFTIKANETAYIFILFNLIKNALYYFKRHPQAIITITVDAPSVTVRDTGPGIPPEVLGTLFGSFVTSDKAGGTGLGLAYCKRTMKAFGGDIVCHSVQGKYTEFTLTFPKVAEAEIELLEHEVLSQAVPFFEGKRILVVDDQPLLRKSTRQMLLGLGSYHDEAEDGSQALEKLRNGVYDLIIMDLDMPVLDGYATAEKIRHGEAQGHEDIAIVAYTAEPAYMAHVKTEKVGMNGFVSKPCSRMELIQALQAGMANAAQRAQLDSVSTTVLVGKKVLIADDSSFNRKIAMAYLRSFGVDAVEAENGKEVLERLSKDETIDALLLDMEMPVMDGMQTARELRSGQTAARHLPIIALTANFSDEHVAQALEAGMDDFMSKPFSIDDLRAKLAKVLTGKGPRAPASPLPTGVAMSPAASLPLIHATQLDRMRRLNNTLLVECLKTYIEQMRESFDRLEILMARGDFNGFRTQLHKMLGDAGESGFYALHQYLRNEIYPTVAYQQKWPEADDWLITARDLYIRTVQAMHKTYLANALP